MNTQTQEALEQPEGKEFFERGKEIAQWADKQAQEPVAWMQNSIELYVQDTPSELYTIPLYTYPHEWQGLTDDEIQMILNKIRDDMYPWKDGMLGHLIARAIEQALKEKNT